MTQYTFNLPLPPLYSEDNFMISDCNREAWQWIQNWENWPAHALLLYGPAGCGKSHLGHIWAQRAQAGRITAASLESVEPRSGNWLIEDIEQLVSERALLHFYNASKENGGKLLLTSTHAANQLPFTLPDLTSRLLALPMAHIDQPDDAVLAGAMRKQLTDRQMKVDDEVIAYIIPRMERSFNALKNTVETIDRAALAEHKNITIPFVKRMLGT